MAMMGGLRLRSAEPEPQRTPFKPLQSPHLMGLPPLGAKPHQSTGSPSSAGGHRWPSSPGDGSSLEATTRASFSDPPSRAITASDHQRQVSSEGLLSYSGSAPLLVRHRDSNRGRRASGSSTSPTHPSKGRRGQLQAKISSKEGAALPEIPATWSTSLPGSLAMRRQIGSPSVPPGAARPSRTPALDGPDLKDVDAPCDRALTTQSNRVWVDGLAGAQDFREDPDSARSLSCGQRSPGQPGGRARRLVDIVSALQSQKRSGSMEEVKIPAKVSANKVLGLVAHWKARATLLSPVRCQSTGDPNMPTSNLGLLGGLLSRGGPSMDEDPRPAAGEFAKPRSSPSSKTPASKEAPGPSDDEEKFDSVAKDGIAPPYVECAPTFMGVCSWYLNEVADAKDSQRINIVFKRFSHDSDIPDCRLKDSMLNLGFLACDHEQVASLMQGISGFNNLDWVDFNELVAKFAQCDREQVLQSAKTFCAELRKDCDRQHVLQRFLREHGVYTSGDSLDYACEMIKLDVDDISVPQDLMRLKAACRVNEGFTTEEVEKLQEIYDELEKKPGTAHIKASQLSEGLLQFEGLYCIDQLTPLMRAVPSLDDGAPPLTFWEFLVWARRLRYAMTCDLFETFAEEDENESGMISMDAVVRMTEKSGFTLPPQVLDCVFEECDLDPKDATLNFNSAVAVVKACRENNGFTPTEIEEHTAIFERFDIHCNGSLTVPQVLDLLRYRGYRTTPQQVDTLIRQVDFNENGTMEMDEFLRLMRLMRESYICEVAKAFDKAKKKARDSCDEVSEKEALWYQTLAREVVPKGIKYLGEHPPEERLEELLSGLPDQVTFAEFLSVADSCREASTVETRRRAGFTDEVYQRLTQIFMRSSAESSSLPLGSMLSMLAHAGLPVNTADGRREMLRSIEVAREAAADAGAPAELVGSSGSQSIGFPVFVQLVKSIIREDELKVMKRETDVLRELKIDNHDAAGLRHVYTSIVDELEGKTNKPPSYGETLKDITTTNRTLEASASTDIVKLLQLRVSARELESRATATRKPARNPGSCGL